MNGDDMSVEEQGEVVSGFLDGLVDAFGYEGDVLTTQIDDETVEVSVEGEDLGLLIGPKGRTLWSIQELSRTVVQRRASGTHHGRVRIDVGGYRARRRAALERFATDAAERVADTGEEFALEPMNPADRKAIHDAANAVDGARTISEGEDRHRRVVILPD